MTSRSKNKRDSNALNEPTIPNHTIEYDCIDISKKCPRFFKLISHEQNATLEELDEFQLELEVLLTDATKRMSLLKNEIKVTKELKTSKNFDEKFRKSKELIYEKSRANLSKNKSKKSKCDILDDTINSQLNPPAYIHPPGQTRIWNFSQEFDLALNKVDPILQYLNSAVSANIHNRDEIKIDVSKASHEEISNLYSLMLQHQNIDSNYENTKRPKLGPYTRRLLSGFIPIEGNSLNDRFIEKSKNLTQSQANIIENSIYKDLGNIGFIREQIQESVILSKEGHINQLQRKLVSQNQYNINKLHVLVRNTKKECAKSEMNPVLIRQHLKCIEKFRDFMASFQKNGRISQTEREHFQRNLDKTSRIVNVMRNLYS